MSKNSRCFASGCNSGYDTCPERVSLFKAPKKAQDRIEWNNVIQRADRTLSERDVLCEKHFDPDDIIRHLMINGIKIPYQRPRLKKCALPKYFGNLSNSKKRKVLKMDINEPIFIDVNNIKEPSLESSQESNMLEDQNILDESDVSYFTKLFTRQEELSSKEYWALFPYENEDKERFIILSQMTIVNNAPAVERQVIVSEFSEIKYYFGNVEIIALKGFHVIDSKRELEETLDTFFKMKFCRGIPRFRGDDQIISITECAYIDNSRNSWRHND